MKLVGEQVLCHGVLDDKSKPKPFGYNKTDLNSTGLQFGNAIVNEDQNVAFHDLKVKDGNIDRSHLVYDEDGWKASKLDSCMSMNDSALDSTKLKDFVAPIQFTRSSLESEQFDRDSVFYIDKNVVEPELPEPVACCMENTCHVVKDICVDEGVRSQDKFLLGTGVDEKKLCTFLIPEKEINSTIAKDMVDLDMNDQFSPKNEASLECDFNDLMQIRKIDNGVAEETENEKSKQVFSLGKLLSTPELGAEPSECKSSLNGIDEAECLSIQTPGVTPTVNSVAEESGRKGELFATRTPDCEAKGTELGHDQTVLAIHAAEESGNDSKEEKLLSHDLECASELTCDSKAETENMTSEFIFAPTMASRREESSQNGGSEQLESRHSSRHEDTNTQPFSGQLHLHQSHGESSFSAVGPLSGLISYSEPIAYSGSLSRRSDSSTTSARSFAFPILQSDWHSSPVRMAKADKRHFGKHKSWKQCLICCRF